MSKKVKQRKYNKQRAESRIQAYADQIGSSVKHAAEDPSGITVVLTDEEIRHLNESQSETEKDITMMDSIKNVANEKVAQTKTFTKSAASKAKDNMKKAGASLKAAYSTARSYGKSNNQTRMGGYAVAGLMTVVSMIVNPAAWAAASLGAIVGTFLILTAYVEIAAFAVWGLNGGSKLETVSIH